MAEEEELKKEISDLKERISQLEELLSDAMAPLSQLNRYASNYFRIIDLYQRFGSVSPDILVPGIDDDISREIVKVLARGKEMNISQVTEAVRGSRGTASRRIVREKLKALEEMGIIDRMEGKTPMYRLSDELARKWAQMLGLIK